MNEILDPAQGTADKDDLDGKLSLAEAATRETPHTAESWKTLGKLLSAGEGDFQRAREAYEKALEIDPNDSETWDCLAKILIDFLGQPDSGLEAARRATELDPHSPYPWNKMGHVYEMHRGDYEQAREFYRKAIEVDPRFAPAWNKLANLLTRRFGEHQKAREAYERAIELDSGFSSAWEGLGSLLTERLGEHQKAREAYERAIQFDPGCARAWDNLAVVLTNRLGEHQRAREAHERAIELDPGFARAWDNLAVLLHNRFGDYQEAREAHERAIELEPTYARAWDNLAVLLNNPFGEHDKAREAHEKAIELEPTYAPAWDNLGVLLHEQFGEHHKAREAHERAVELDPTFARGWDNLGVLLHEQFGEHHKAREAHERAIKLNPSYAPAWDNLGVLLHQPFAEHQTARDAHEKAIQLDPTYAPAWDNLGVLLTNHFTEFQRAEFCYREAIRLNPRRASPWVNLGALYWDHFHDIEEAESAFLRATEICPENDLAWKNLGGLYAGHQVTPNYPLTATRCLKRFILIASRQPGRKVLRMIESLEHTGCPLFSIRWLGSLPFSTDLINAFPRLAALRNEHAHAADKWSRYAELLPSGASLDKVYLLHALGDPVAAYRESCAAWSEAPRDPARAALAHFMAIEVLELAKAQEILQASLSACRAFGEKGTGDAFRAFSAALLLEEAGENISALACLERCAGTEFEYPALWLRWRLAKEAGHGLADFLATEIAKVEKKRSDDGEWLLSIPLGVDQIGGDWENARVVVRRLMIQEHLTDAVLAFIDEEEDRLPRLATMERWESWRQFNSRIRDFPGEEIARFKKDEWISSVITVFGSAGGEALIKHLAGLLKTTSLKTRRDLENWIRLVRCHLHDSRLEPSDPKVGVFLAYLVMKHQNDSGKIRLITAVATVPGLLLYFIGAGQLVCTLVLAALTCWDKVYDPSASFPDFADFESKYDLIASHPVLAEQIFGTMR